MNLNYDKVRYRNKYYAIINSSYNDIDVPIIVDWEDIATIENINKNWRCNKNGLITCYHTYKNKTKEVALHEIIMALFLKDSNKRKKNRPIIHLNRIGLDNRRENLIYDIINKDTNKNMKKKKRTINLPRSSGIKVEEIPTYIWYMKPNGSHGSRFMVDIGNIKWKTTASKRLSLRYKLEEAKEYLRQLRKEKPEYFDDYSMNGDLTKDGINLRNSFFRIVNKLDKYKHICNNRNNNNTSIYLKHGALTRKEKILLKSQGNLIKNTKRRRTINNLPKNCGLTSYDIPEYCYYRPAYNGRGGYFIVRGHPKQKKIWQTSSSKKISIKDKYNDLLKYINNL